MKIKWLGHSCFLITSEDGTRIITDPYTAGGDIKYGKITEAADIVVISHQHYDHDNAQTVKGSPRLITGAGSQKTRGIEFKGVKSFHDASGGSERGSNTIFCFTVDEIRVCHLGDLGHELSKKQVSEIGEVDILLIPTGGGATIAPATATQVCEEIKPRVAIPMHYKTSKCAFPPARVDDFLKGKARVNRVGASGFEFKKEKLPEATEVWEFEHAM
jgi:L-ascorbate metabolism protein UlaG (beta-lactamase superfamily)